MKTEEMIKDLIAKLKASINKNDELSAMTIKSAKEMSIMNLKWVLEE